MKKHLFLILFTTFIFNGLIKSKCQYYMNEIDTISGDTVLITTDGIDMLTYYPRDLDSLVIPI